MISLSNATVFAAKPFVPGAKATARYELSSNGTINKYVNGTKTNLGNWISPASGENGYEAEATITSGTLSGGISGSWLNLGNTVAWEEDESAHATATVVFSLSIRDVATHTVQATATITLEAALLS